MTVKHLEAVELADGSLAVTQSAGDNTEKLATTEYVDRAKRSVVSEVTSTSSNLALSQLEKSIKMNNASAMNLTILNDSTVSWPDHAQGELFQYGAGQITIVAGSGVTLRVRSALTLKSAGQYAYLGYKRIGANEWLIFGDLEPA